MSLQSGLPERVRPWYLLDAAAFLVGAGASVRHTAHGFDGVADLSLIVISSLSLLATVTAVVSGLFAVFVLRVTVGNLWGYAVEYANAGGQWSDPPFLVPVGGGLVAVAATYVVTGSPATAAWAGFWAFVVVAGVVAAVVSFAAGYQDSLS
jgi:hypothetical protein